MDAGSGEFVGSGWLTCCRQPACSRSRGRNDPSPVAESSWRHECVSTAPWMHLEWVDDESGSEDSYNLRLQEDRSTTW